jgi:hypothetical protein
MPLSIDSFVAVPVSHDLYAELTRRYPAGPAWVIEQALQDFLDRTAEDFEAQRPLKQGVQWDSVFLPDGTQVRTKYYGEYQIAEIIDGEIIWKEKAFLSLSQLASAMRGDTSNNAWKVLEVKRPMDSSWIAADRLRR